MILITGMSVNQFKFNVNGWTSHCSIQLFEISAICNRFPIIQASPSICFPRGHVAINSIHQSIAIGVHTQFPYSQSDGLIDRMFGGLDLGNIVCSIFLTTSGCIAIEKKINIEYFNFFNSFFHIFFINKELLLFFFSIIIRNVRILFTKKKDTKKI